MRGDRHGRGMAIDTRRRITARLAARWHRQPADLLGVGGGRRSRSSCCRSPAMSSRRSRTCSTSRATSPSSAIIAHRHDRRHHHRRHRPLGRRGAGAVGHGDRHDDERRHVDLAGGTAGARRVAAGRRVQRRADRLRRRAAVRRDAGHAVDRAQPGDGAVGQPDGLPVRPRPAEAPGARRRLRRPAAAAARRDPRAEPGAVPARAAGDHRVRVSLDAMGPPPLRHRRQRAAPRR